MNLGYAAIDSQGLQTDLNWSNDLTGSLISILKTISSGSGKTYFELAIEFQARTRVCITLRALDLYDTIYSEKSGVQGSAQTTCNIGATEHNVWAVV